MPAPTALPATCSSLEFFWCCHITWHWLHGDLPSWLLGSRYLPSSPLVRVILSSLFLWPQTQCKNRSILCRGFYASGAKILPIQTSNTSWDPKSRNGAGCTNSFLGRLMKVSQPFGHWCLLIMGFSHWVGIFLSAQYAWQHLDSRGIANLCRSGHGTQCCTTLRVFFRGSHFVHPMPEAPESIITVHVLDCGQSPQPCSHQLLTINQPLLELWGTKN